MLLTMTVAFFDMSEMIFPIVVGGNIGEIRGERERRALDNKSARVCEPSRAADFKCSHRRHTSEGQLCVAQPPQSILLFATAPIFVAPHPISRSCPRRPACHAGPSRPSTLTLPPSCGPTWAAFPGAASTRASARSYRAHRRPTQRGFRSGHANSRCASPTRPSTGRTLASTASIAAVPPPLASSTYSAQELSAPPDRGTRPCTASLRVPRRDDRQRPHPPAYIRMTLIRRPTVVLRVYSTGHACLPAATSLSQVAPPVVRGRVAGQAGWSSVVYTATTTGTGADNPTLTH